MPLNSIPPFMEGMVGSEDLPGAAFLSGEKRSCRQLLNKIEGCFED